MRKKTPQHCGYLANYSIPDEHFFLHIPNSMYIYRKKKKTVIRIVPQKFNVSFLMARHDAIDDISVL